MRLPLFAAAAALLLLTGCTAAASAAPIAAEAPAPTVTAPAVDGVYACQTNAAGELECAPDTHGLLATETGVVRDVCTGELVTASYSTVNATVEQIAALCQ